MIGRPTFGACKRQSVRVASCQTWAEILSQAPRSLRSLCERSSQHHRRTVRGKKARTGRAIMPAILNPAASAL